MAPTLSDAVLRFFSSSADRRLRPFARIDLFEFLHVVADAVQIAEHVVHKDFAVVRCKPFLENIGGY